MGLSRSSFHRGGGEEGTPAVVVVSIDAVAPRADLTPFAWGYTFEIDGVPAVPDEVEWTYTGDADVSLDSATADAPTCTPTLPGYVRRSLRARKDGVDYYAPVSSVRIGDGSALVVYTQDINGQAGLAPVDLVVEVVKGGLTITPDMVVWVVDESDSGIADAFAASTTYTPVAVGRHEAVPACLVRDTWYRGAPASFVVGEAFSCTITGIDDQVTLDPVNLTGTVNGGVGVLTYEWSVNGVVVSTAESFSYTPTTVGKHTVTRKVTDSIGQVARCQEEVFRVGTTTGWVLLWKAITADLSDHDFNTTATKTIDGVDVTRSHDGTTPTTHAISSGVWTIDTVTGAGNAAGVTFAPVQKLDNLAAYEVCFIIGTGATITANLDGVFVAYVASAGTYVVVEARREGGNQVVRRDRSATVASLTMPGGLQARVVGLHLSPQRVGFRPLYSQTAWTGNGPTPDDLTVGGGTPSGWHVTADKAPSATTDAFAPNNDVGASPDTIQVKGRAENGTAYTLAGITYWVRGL